MLPQIKQIHTGSSLFPYLSHSSITTTSKKEKKKKMNEILQVSPTSLQYGRGRGTGDGARIGGRGEGGRGEGGRGMGRSRKGVA